MTQGKKLKRRIRERAARTGESYAAARRHVLNEVDDAREERSREGAAEARRQPATGAVTEVRCIEVTGHGFDHWIAVLDRFGAAKQGHAASARHLQHDHGLSAWYAQSLTVVYERARGLRVCNEGSGGFQVSVSRVLPAPYEAARRYLVDPAARDTWLDEVDVGVAEQIRAADLRSRDDAVWVRLRFPESRVELRISAKGEKSSTVARVEQLPDAEAVEPARAAWRSVLEALKRAVSS